MVPIFERDELAVRLSLPRSVDLADSGWLVLEFENRGAEPLPPPLQGHLRMEAQRYALSAPEFVRARSGLASGQLSNLWPREPGSTGLLPIPPGGSLMEASHLSDYATGMVGRGLRALRVGILPSPRPMRDVGQRVAARLHLRLDWPPFGRLETPVEGVPFEFEWLPLAEERLELARARLEDLLSRPEAGETGGYALGALLGSAQVAEPLTMERLFAVLEQLGGDWRRRPVVWEHLIARFHRDPRLQERFLGAVRAGVPGSFANFRDRRLWRPEVAEHLVRFAEAAPQSVDAVLEVMHFHRRDWHGNDDLVGRLSAVLRARHPVLAYGPEELPNGSVREWARAVGSWSRTGDPVAVEALRLFLSDQREIRVRGLSGISAVPFTPAVAPLRVCDAALDAISTLLDGDSYPAYRAHGHPAGTPRRGDFEAYEVYYVALRDRMIASLLERLEARRAPGPADSRETPQPPR